MRVEIENDVLLFYLNFVIFFVYHGFLIFMKKIRINLFKIYLLEEKASNLFLKILKDNFLAKIEDFLITKRSFSLTAPTPAP